MSDITLKDILVAINELSEETKAMRVTVGETGSRVTNIEERVANLELEMKDMRRDIRELDQKVTIFSESLIDKRVSLSLLQ